MNKNKTYWIVFSLLLLLLVVVQYYGLVKFRYPVPPGHDAMILWNNIVLFQNNTVDFFTYLSWGSYPPLFFYSIAQLAKFFNNDAMRAMLWLMPSILVFSSLAIFFLAYKITNRYVALTSFLIYAFASKNPIQQLNDGGYPNLIASQIILPLVFLFYYFLITSKAKVKPVFLVLLTTSIILIFLTHHLTTLYVVALLLISPLILTFHQWKSCQRKTRIITTISLLLFYLLLIYGFFSSQFLVPAKNLMATAITFIPGFPFFQFINNADPEAKISLLSYPGYIGHGLLLFGLIGLVLSYIGKPFRGKNTILILSIFLILLLAGSRLPSLTNPDRLVRDAAFPLSIFAGIAIYEILSYTGKLKKNTIITAISIVLITSIFSITALPRIKKAFQYEPMVRTTDADLETINCLKSKGPGKVFVESYNFYLPYFLPDWETTYLWNPFTDQSNVNLINPKNDVAYLSDFEYIYLTESQTGWLPQGVKIGRVSEYLKLPEYYELISDHRSATNHIYLFKVRK